MVVLFFVLMFKLLPNVVLWKIWRKS